MSFFFFFFQAEDGIRDKLVTGVQTCALPISTADATSGPMPSPGISVIRCIKLNRYFVPGALYFGVMGVKSQRTEYAARNSMMNQFSELRVADVVIVGGGVIGLTIARALAKRGARD